MDSPIEPIVDVGTVTSEVLIGDRVGRDIAADVPTVFTEVIYKTMPLEVRSQWTEALVSLPADPISPSHQVKHFGLDALQQRSTLPGPSDVWSWSSAVTLRSQVVIDRTNAWPYSSNAVASMRAMAIVGRPLPIWRSFYRTSTVHALAVRSRTIAYQPQSGVFAAALRTLAAQQRPAMTPPADVWSPLRTSTLCMLAVVSRQETPAQPSNDEAATLRMLVLAKRIPLVAVDEYAGQAVQAVVQTRVPAVPFSFDAAAQVQQAVVVLRTTSLPRSPVALAQARWAVLQQHVAPWPVAPAIVANYLPAIVAARSTPWPHSMAPVASFVALAAARRLTFRPDETGAWSFGTLEMRIVSARETVPPDRTTHMQVRHASVAYVMHRTTKPPIEVIDPTTGRLVKTATRVITCYRSTVAPDEVMRRQRVVHALSEHLVLRDRTFPAPPTEPEESTGEVAQVAQQVVLPETDWEWDPTSRITATQVVQTPAVADLDGWIDPLAADSDLDANQVVETPVVRDFAFPDGHAPQSDAQAHLAAMAPVARDFAFPDGHMPQSDADVHAVGQVAAAVDDSFPPADMPQSDADVHAVGQQVASRDNSMVGNLPVSPIDIAVVLEMVAVPDKKMFGIPERQPGPRPRISIIRR